MVALRQQQAGPPWDSMASDPPSGKAGDYVRYAARAALAPARWFAAAARPGEGLLILSSLSVHEPVDDLCKKAASLCAGGRNAGDCSSVPLPIPGFYLGERHSHPVHEGKTCIVHIAHCNA